MIDVFLFSFYLIVRKSLPNSFKSDAAFPSQINTVEIQLQLACIYLHLTSID